MELVKSAERPGRMMTPLEKESDRVLHVVTEDLVDLASVGVPQVPHLVETVKSDIECRADFDQGLVGLGT